MARSGIGGHWVYHRIAVTARIGNIIDVERTLYSFNVLLLFVSSSCVGSNTWISPI
jgi:hypothetical protein